MSLLSKFFSKIVTCPSCKQRIRLPVKPGKTLRITCQKCQAQFEIKLINPLRDVVTWNRQLSFLQNTKVMIQRYLALPFKARLMLMLCFFVLFLSILSIIRPLVLPTPPNTPSTPHILEKPQ